MSYEWDFDGDGTFDLSSASATASHSYAQFSSYTTVLRVTDDNTPAKTATASLVINVNQGNLAAGGPHGRSVHS